MRYNANLNKPIVKIDILCSNIIVNIPTSRWSSSGPSVGTSDPSYALRGVKRCACQCQPTCTLMASGHRPPARHPRLGAPPVSAAFEPSVGRPRAARASRSAATPIALAAVRTRQLRCCIRSSWHLTTIAVLWSASTASAAPAATSTATAVTATLAAALSAGLRRRCNLLYLLRLLHIPF